MDVEQMMRVNALSKELRRHNFAGTSQEAVVQAEQALGFSQPAQSLASTQVLQEPPQEIVQGEPVQQHVSQQSDYYMLNKKIEILVKKNNKHLENQIDALKELVRSLNDELAQVKKAVHKKEEQKTIVLQTAQQQAPQPVAQPTPAPKAPAKPYHPKQGNVSSADVSIEKMFYFGNKR